MVETAPKMSWSDLRRELPRTLAWMHWRVAAVEVSSEARGRNAVVLRGQKVSNACTRKRVWIFPVDAAALTHSWFLLIPLAIAAD